MNYKNQIFAFLFALLIVAGCEQPPISSPSLDTKENQGPQIQAPAPQATYVTEEKDKSTTPDPNLFEHLNYACAQILSEPGGPIAYTCCCNMRDIKQSIYNGRHYVGVEVGDPLDNGATHWFLTAEFFDEQTQQNIGSYDRNITSMQNDCDNYWNYFFGVNLPSGISFHPTCPNYLVTATFKIYRSYNGDTSNRYLCSTKVGTITIHNPLDPLCF